MTESIENKKVPAFFNKNQDGSLERPKNYRTRVYVGTPLTPNDINNGKAAFPEFHNVYIDPISFNHFQETGKLREGIILIKELVSLGSKAAVSGKGYFMGDFIGLEATIKSSAHFHISLMNQEIGLISALPILKQEC